MTNDTKVYLVGNERSPNTNQWLAMTNNWSEAERLKAEIGPTATHKVVLVPPKRGKRRESN